jgi:hypothetical protein
MLRVLWPIRVGAWFCPFDGEFLEGLRGELLAAHQSFSTGSEIWERLPHNLADVPTQRLRAVFDWTVSCVHEYTGKPLEILHIDSRELVRVAGQEILHHSDRDEGDITAQFFLDGLNPHPGVSWDDINRFGENAFHLDDPSMYGSERRMPWEQFHRCWIQPFKGLVVLYPSRLPHAQRPYKGDDRFVQLLINLKVSL